MIKSPGKIFEEDFSRSVPSYCLIHRLKDSAQSYNNSNATRFTWDNPCDFFVFDGSILYCFELKSTKSKSMSYQIDKNDVSSRMIKYHQIESLTKFSKYENVLAGLVLNFRDEKNDSQRTYFIDIKNFNKMIDSIGKRSVNEIDILLNGAIKIQGNKKRTRYSWDIDAFLESQHSKTQA